MPLSQAEVDGNVVALEEAAHGHVGIAGETEVATHVAATACGDDAQGRKGPPGIVHEAVDDLIDGAVSTHGDDERLARAHRAPRQFGGGAPGCGLGELEIETSPGQAVLEARPQSSASPAARGRVDHDEGALNATARRGCPLARDEQSRAGLPTSHAM